MTDTRFKDLDDVRLKSTLHGVPKGTRGTVVGVWKEGLAYEVEFSEPFGPPPLRLITVVPGDIELTNVKS